MEMFILEKSREREDTYCNSVKVKYKGNLILFTLLTVVSSIGCTVSNLIIFIQKNTMKKREREILM